jgi:predicted metal-dependent phosphoesterase TrpH
MTQAAGVRVDPHVKVLDDVVVARAKARGLDVLVYAPHFTPLPKIRERAAHYTDDDLLVIPARELFTGSWRHRRHVLALGLEEPVPDFITLEGTMDELRRQDATVLVPHPEFLTVSLDSEEIQQYRTLIDALEVYNPKHLSHHNRRARRLAEEFDLPPFTSSYAHLRGTVGEAVTTFEGSIDSAADLSELFSTGAPRTVSHEAGLRHQLRCGLEFAHLGWENSWTKFDRVAREGVEATHPSQDRYGERFENVTAY